MNLNLNMKTGAKFRLKTSDGQQSPWFCNMILDSAIDLMMSGFTEEPTPTLGSSIIEVDATQTGVLAPIFDMVAQRTRDVREPTFTRVSNTSASVSFLKEYTFKNTGTVSAQVSEVGFSNLNRALFKDEQGIVKAWPVAPNEEVLVEMEFVIAITTPASALPIDIVNSNNEVVDTLNVSLFIPNMSNGITPLWWKLLSKPADEVKLVTDAGYGGIDIPQPADVVEASVPSTYMYDGREIDITVNHLGAVGGQTFKGFIVGFGCLAPSISVVYDKTITVGGNYTFKAVVNVTW